MDNTKLEFPDWCDEAVVEEITKAIEELAKEEEDIPSAQ
jgi:hypothetical protein